MNTIEQKNIYNYWKRKLEGAAANDLSAPDRIETTSIKEVELSYFNQLTNGNPLAEHSILMLVFNVLLQRYFASDQFIFSLGTAPKATPLLYKFTAIKGKTLKQYIEASKSEIQEVYANSDYQDDVQQNYAFERYTPYAFFYNAARFPAASFPFELRIDKNDQALDISLTYSEKFVDEPIAGQFIKSIENWLLNLKNYLNEDLSAIALLSEQEAQSLLQKTNSRSTAFNSNENIISLFEKQVSKTSDRAAVVFESRMLTYNELNSAANQFAKYLIDRYGIAQGDFVAVKLERTEQLLIALLAILKTGAAYVPVDVNYPEERIKYIENHSKSRLVVNAEEIKAFNKSKDQYSKENIRIQCNENDIAYVIYTSGTTGNPKGVMITHKNAAALIFWAIEEFDDSKFDVVYAATSHCFDLSVFEMFYTLSIGKKVKVLTNAIAIGPALENDEKILLNTVPSSIRNLLNNESDLQNVTVINLAGEIFPVEIAEKLIETNAEIRNLYGPSEDTTYSTCYKLEASKPYSFIPIGKPIANTEAYILDDSMNLVPFGVVGKLYLSGAGVAKGYLNNPDLTREKFRDDPFNKGQIMYDTGDLAKWMSDGNLKFLGRNDDQVKLRGYRIELGEIENGIFSFSENILQACSVVKDDVLIGYYLENAPINKTQLLAYLEKKLPSYMIPNQLIKVDEIPLTPNGKVDKNKLSQIKSQHGNANYEAPSNQLEEKAIKIWELVLGVSPIGLKDNFFELGGHSLMVSQVINLAYKELNQKISHKSFYENPTIRGFAKALESLKYESIPQTALKDDYPLTPSQQRLWLLSQFEGSNKAYQISGALKIINAINQSNFVKALGQTISRHEILRTAFRTNATGEVRQYIIPENEFQFEVELIDFSDKKAAEQLIETYIREQDSKVYDLAKLPLLKASLLKTNNENFVFYLSMHHIISDGWSLNVLTNEILEQYDALQKNTVAAISAKPAIQYKDYAVWLSNEQQKQDFKASKKYWISQFEGEIPILQLADYTSRPDIKTYNGNHVQHVFPEKLLEQLKSLSKDNQTTFFTLLMASVKILLSKYSNQDDIIVGIPVSGREHPDLEDQMGLFVNTLAIRTLLDRNENFLDLVAKEKEQLSMAFEHQDIPFDMLVEQIEISRDLSRSPLFDVMVVLQNQDQLNAFNNEKKSRLSIEPYEIQRDTSQFDLTFVFSEKNGLDLRIIYNTDLFDAEFPERILKHLNSLFEQIVQSPTMPLKDIALVSESEKKTLLESFNKQETVFADERNIVDLFETQVALTPQDLAVVHQGKSLTYKELDQMANRLANYLIENHKISKSDLVAVRVKRGENMVLSLLGILKSGAAYVPLEVNYPEKRIEAILEDTNAKILIDDSFLTRFLETENNAANKPRANIKNTDMLYVLYTSGSTGKPKGVMIDHKSVINFMQAYNLKKCNTSLTCNYVFDVSVMEIFASITSGSTLFIPELETVMSPESYAAFLFENQINHCYLHPMHIEQIAQKLDTYDNVFLKRILIGVESIKKDAVAWYLNKGVEIINGYGPSEATICATFYRVNDLKAIPGSNLPIGKPIQHTAIYILEEDSNSLAPHGVIGELCISGIGLSKGYLNKPEATAEKFVENPFVPNEKLYRTGDLARWLPDGNIEFIGRKDSQIKIRGHRVELGEIEANILAFSPNVSHAVALIKTINSEKALAAYYVSAENIDKKELRDYLISQLPSYMVPSHYIELEALPITTNGKIDREKLPAISESDIVKKELLLPESETEVAAASIWQSILDIQKIGLLDDFFELGGHSLLLTKLLNDYQKNFNALISLEQLYANTTLKSHVALLAGSSSQNHQIEKVALQEHYSLSSSQMRYWLINKIQGKSRMYNIYSILDLPNDLNTAALERSLNQLVERHEALRTFFTEDKGTPKQGIRNAAVATISYCDSREEAMRKVFEHEFDLDEYPLFKIAVVQEPGVNTLFFNIHHSICDGWSIKIIERDLIELYEAAIAQRKPVLSELPIQYKDYANWQNNLLELPEMANHENYWKNALKNELAYLQLPTDYPAASKTTQKNASFYNTYISEAQKQKIESLSGSVKSSPFAFFVATLKILLHRLTSEKDIIIGIPVANRNHYQVKDTVGCFINTLMLRDIIDDKTTFKRWLQNANSTLTAALSHQEYPFEKVLAQLNYSKEDAGFPISPVFLNMIDFDSKPTEAISDFSASHGHLESTPKFDLECYVKSYANGYALNFVYDTGLFKEETIAYWADAYLSIVDQAATDASQPIKNIKFFENPIYPATDVKPSHQYTAYDRSEIQQRISERFEKQVKQYPKSIAVKANGKELSYDTLNRHANHLAQQIVAAIGDDSHGRIALLLSHDESATIGMLGASKAGYAYVPIDADTPVKRIEYILADATCKLVLCNAATFKQAQNAIKALPETVLIQLAENDMPEEIPNPKTNKNELSEAYVLYTSGSSGMPKGVAQNHRNVLHYISEYTNNIRITQQDKLSVISTYTFDASVKDIYGAILNGACVDFYDMSKKGVTNLESWLQNEKITILHIIPTIYRYFLKERHEEKVFETVRVIDLGGEPCHKIDFDLFKEHFPKGAFLINDYGPTEATIVSQKFLNHESEIIKNNIPLGSAVAETELFLLDENNSKRGIYQQGEIAFKSEHLSLGYLNKKELTEKAFITDPSTGTGRIYKSGDIGKMLPTGEIEFLHRKDTQVKVNGLRIELAEIEYHLEQIETISEAVVLIKTIEANQHIVAYVRAKQQVEQAVIKAVLSESLPKYMIPAVCFSMTDFPRTRTGKIDRKSFPDLTISDLKTTPYVPPETDLEKQLTDIWSRVLKIEDTVKIGILDNFFELGGNSLQAVVLINEINKTYNTSFSVINLYDTLTIKDLAVLLYFAMLQNINASVADQEQQEQDEVIL